MSTNSGHYFTEHWLLFNCLRSTYMLQNYKNTYTWIKLTTGCSVATFEVNALSSCTDCFIVIIIDRINRAVATGINKIAIHIPAENHANCSFGRKEPHFWINLLHAVVYQSTRNGFICKPVFCSKLKYGTWEHVWKIY